MYAFSIITPLLSFHWASSFTSSLSFCVHTLPWFLSTQGNSTRMYQHIRRRSYITHQNRRGYIRTKLYGRRVNIIIHGYVSKPLKLFWTLSSASSEAPICLGRVGGPPWEPRFSNQPVYCPFSTICSEYCLQVQWGSFSKGKIWKFFSWRFKENREFQGILFGLELGFLELRSYTNEEWKNYDRYIISSDLI